MKHKQFNCKHVLGEQCICRRLIRLTGGLACMKVCAPTSLQPTSYSYCEARGSNLVF